MMNSNDRQTPSATRTNHSKARERQNRLKIEVRSRDRRGGEAQEDGAAGRSDMPSQRIVANMRRQRRNSL
jgi:hypothetical protein